jgi:hypothetical protein
MAVDIDPHRRKWWLSERQLSASLADDSGYNRVLEEEESTAVLRVGSDGEGGSRWWHSPVNRDGGQQGGARASRARWSACEGGEEAKCEKAFSSRPRAGFIDDGIRRVAAKRW